MTKLTLLDIFGESYEREGEIGDVRIHGYENNGGSWAFYNLSEGWTPCYQVAIRWKRKHKFVWVNKSRIIKGVPV